MLNFAVLIIVTLVAASSSDKRQTAESFGLYAYGKDVGGWSVRYSNDSAYIIAADQALSDFSAVNFTTSATGLMAQGTVAISSIASNDTSPANKVLAIVPDTNAAVVFEDSAATVGSSEQWTFFGAMLTYQSTQSTFQAVPTSVENVYQIYWVADAANAPTGAIPVLLKKSAPAAPARPFKGGGIGSAEMRKRKEKRTLINAQ